MAKLTEQDQRDLSKALSYANWSALGLIIPFVGWLLGGMALSFIKTIPVTSQSKERIKQVKRAAWLGIILASVAAAAWGGYYKYQQIQDKKAAEAAQQQAWDEQKRKDDAEFEATQNKLRAQNGLNNCLGEAYDSYKEGFLAESRNLGRTDGLLPQANVDRWDKRYKDAQDACYRQFNAGLFDNYIPIFDSN
jgi:hypothetical protein